MKKIILGLLFIILIGSFFFLKKEDSEVKTIFLKGAESQVSYVVEISDTPQKAEMGLMWRKSMPQNQGMLFIFQNPSVVKMWMKNTYIPLDMLFFNAQGQVICLHKNAHPLDESIISCPYPAKMVLEVNAGEIEEKNIRLGDQLFMK